MSNKQRENSIVVPSAEDAEKEAQDEIKAAEAERTKEAEANAPKQQRQIQVAPKQERLPDASPSRTTNAITGTAGLGIPATRNAGYTGVVGTGLVEANLKAFITELRNAKDVGEIAMANYKLYVIIKDILRNDEREQFRLEWLVLLGFVADHYDKEVNETTVFQALYKWPLGEREMTGFRYLMRVVFDSLEPTTRRKALAEMDVKLLVGQITAVASSNAELNLYSFYEV